MLQGNGMTEMLNKIKGSIKIYALWVTCFISGAASLGLLLYEGGECFLWFVISKIGCFALFLLYAKIAMRIHNTT